MQGTIADNKRIAKNTIFLYARMVVVMLISLFSTRELLRVLGVEDYGVYNVVCGFVSMFAFLNTSMANGTQRFYNFEIGKNQGKELNKIFTHAMYIQLAISLLIVFAVETFGLWYLNNKMVIPDNRFSTASWIFQFALLKLLMIMIAVPYSAAIMAYEHMNFYALLSILDSVLNLLIVYSLSLFETDFLMLYGLLSLFVGVINLILNVAYCKKKFKNVSFIGGFDKDLFKGMFSFSGWNIFGSLAHMMKGQGVNMVFNFFWGPIVNAANGVAAQINNAINSLTTGFLTATRPQMIQNYASGNIDYFKKMYYSTSKLAFYLIMVLVVPIVFDVRDILNVWLGEGNYPEITVIMCQMTLIATLCGSYATPTSIVAHATGKMKKFQVLVSSVLLCEVPFAIVAAKLGLEAFVIIIISAILNLIAQVVRLFIIREQVGFSIMQYTKFVFYPTLAVFLLSLVLSFLVHSILHVTGLLVVVHLFISFIISTVSILLLGLDKSERNLIFSLIKKHF